MKWTTARDRFRKALCDVLPDDVRQNRKFNRQSVKYKRSLARNRAIRPDGKFPPVFNEFGEPFDMFYLRDEHYAHQPSSRFSRHFLWDRHNWGLDVHFYTGFHMFEPLCDAERRYGWLVESETIATAEYEAVYRDPNALADLDKVFTFSERVLDALPHAVFAPAGYVRYAHPWYDSAVRDDGRYKKKTKGISIVSSNKEMCPLHTVRKNVALKCLKNSGLGVDVYGTVGGGQYALPDDYLSAYRFSLAFENDIQKYFFTEKILNCFASMTVPVYLGAGGIAEFFNPDGIIFLSTNDCDTLGDVVKQCTEEEYAARLDAVLDNYARVQEYYAVENYIYNHYFLDDPYFARRRERTGQGGIARICQR